MKERQRAECGAKTRAGGRCRKVPVKGRNRCALHGGKSLAGVASPRFKSGRYSRFLPERLLERYAEAEHDASLLQLRSEIALTDARISELLQGLANNESGSAWKKMGGLLKEYLKVNDIGRGLVLGRMQRLIDDGVGDAEAWQEIGFMLDRRRRLVESERKRLVEMRQVVSLEEIMVFVQRLASILKAHIPDRRQLAEVTAEIRSVCEAEPAALAGETAKRLEPAKFPQLNITITEPRD